MSSLVADLVFNTLPYDPNVLLLVGVAVDCLYRRRIAPFLAFRRALGAGMMVRAQCRGFSVRFVDTTAYRGQPIVEFAVLGKGKRRVPATSMRDAVWVCDQFQSGHPILADSIIVRCENGERIAVPDVAEGFDELLEWLRANVPLEQRIVPRHLDAD